jgi:hypothetical protein
VQPNEHLVLIEEEPHLPTGSARPRRAIYFQEHASRRAFRVCFVPAIIGRADPDLPDDMLVAVDLSGCQSGSSVSRRHLKLTEDSGALYLQTLSTNPASLIRCDAEIPISAAPDRVRLEPGDVIRLDRSDIRLKLVVREE